VEDCINGGGGVGVGRRNTSGTGGCRSVGNEGEGGYTEITGSINMQ